MGSCQGGFCGFRTVGLLYDLGHLRGREGLATLTGFLEKRWGGIKPVLWGGQLVQEQLLEAHYCGTLNIDGEL
jgi:glycerol-3-phosphate dehydrogenase